MKIVEGLSNTDSKCKQIYIPILLQYER